MDLSRPLYNGGHDLDGAVLASALNRLLLPLAVRNDVEGGSWDRRGWIHFWGRTGRASL